MYKIIPKDSKKTNQFKDLIELISFIGSKKILILTGKKSFKKSASEKFIRGQLSFYSGEHTYYSDFQANPKLEDLNKAIEVLKPFEFDLIIACGGGSVIDFAKLLKIYVNKKELIENFPENYSVPNKTNVSLIAIPTTAGTGSEATHFAVLYKDNIKYSVASDAMLPEYSILNSSICVNAAFKIKASCIIDAFSQAIESYWSVNATEKSREYASQAIMIINRNILSYRQNHSKVEVTEEILRAAHLSGKAINISKTTAPHALSYSLTSIFKIPHGHAVGMMLGEFFVINELETEGKKLNCTNPKKHLSNMRNLRKMLGWGDPINCRDNWQKIMKYLGLDIQVKFKNKNKAIKELSSSVNAERLSNNPIALSDMELIEIYKKLFKR